MPPTATQKMTTKASFCKPPRERRRGAPVSGGSSNAIFVGIAAGIAAGGLPLPAAPTGMAAGRAACPAAAGPIGMAGGRVYGLPTRAPSFFFFRRRRRLRIASTTRRVAFLTPSTIRRFLTAWAWKTSAQCLHRIDWPTNDAGIFKDFLHPGHRAFTTLFAASDMIGTSETTVELFRAHG